MLMVDQHRMREALDLAQKSMVRVSPNPRVGCVIYSTSGERIAEGVTSPPGGPHAEINALNHATRAGLSLHDAIVYVTLEPCAHTGRTGPCVDALIKAKVGRVCVGAIDPNPLVGGLGVERLRAAGVRVDVGVLADECVTYHSPFFKWIKTGSPWVSLKGAMTLDGCLATASGDSKWITGIAARTHVHQLRAQVDALMIGGETARRDRPALTVRHCEGSDPVPIALSRSLSIPNDAPMVKEGALLFHGSQASTERRRQLEALGAELIEVELNSEGRELSLSQVLSSLGDRGVTHLCVEGGGRLHGSFLREDLVDDLHLYIAPRLIGRGKPLFNFSSVETIRDGYSLINTHSRSLGDDLYFYGRLNRK